MSYLMPRILVVDDEPRMCDSLKILLADKGYDIKTSNCGEEAIVHVTKHHFDLVLLDVVMPGMDGYEVLDHLKRHHPELLIIMMTGNASVDSAVGALRRGAYDYLSKPFSHEGLLNRVENALEQKRSKIEKEILSRKLELSETRYRYLVQHSPDLICILSPAGDFLFINNTVEHLLGTESSSLIGRHFTSIIAGDNRDQANQYLRKIAENGSLADPLELQLRAAEGAPLSQGIKPPTVELRAVHLADIIDDDRGNGTPGIYCIARDITASKQAREALRISEEKYSNILEDIREGYYETDLSGNFTFFNQSFHKTLGYARDELMGVNHGQCMNPENAKKAVQLLSNIQKTALPAQRLEWEYIRRDGSLIIVDTSIFATKNSTGQPTGFRGIIRDVTERKRLEASLLQAQKMEAVGTLAGGIAHDFNNLLMGIHGYTSLILMTMSPGNPHYEKLKSIEQHVQSGAELTRQLLGFARGGKYEVKPTRLNDLVIRSIALFGRTKKELTISRKLPEDLWNVSVDRGQIEQVLLNLYVNAWQAMPSAQGGTIDVQTENITVRQDSMMPFPMEPGNYVKISVADTGSGMDERTLERLFEPFFTTKEMGRGTGLGLASAYGIIKGHGGFISVTSKLGEGTVFDIYLPATAREIVEEEAPVCQITKGHETILLVDDEEAIINVTRDILEMLNYTVLVASSGQEAIDIYQRKQDGIDLVVLDMVMPGMGGGETFDKLKEINPDIKVILSSGYSISGRATKIMERGCRSFIQKPFNINEISSKLREALDK